MAATGFTPVYIYASGTTSNIPSASNLTNTTNGSEIALNYFDGKLFYKNASNLVVTVPLLQSSGSQNGWLSSTDWTTFNSKQAALVSGTNIKTVSGITLLGSGDLGTIGTAYGGTGLTGFTSANNAIYSTSSSALTAGTLPIAAGGTAQTSFTSGRIHYGSFSTSANLTTDGTDLTLGTGNLIIGTSGKGIDFSATAQPAGMTSELLADYEEGTWTPVYTPTTGSFTSITASNTGWYRKIGSLVVAGFSIKTTAATTIGTASGTLKITGLPYTVYTDAGGSGSVAAFQQWNLGTAFTNIGVTADSNSTFLYFSKNSSNSYVAYVQATELNTAAGSFNNLMQGFIIYKTTA